MFFARLGWQTIHVEAQALFMPRQCWASVMREAAAGAI
jgi:hypothetical protein